jgi:5-formyltetrahydrofolate cyclo-ligase
MCLASSFLAGRNRNVTKPELRGRLVAELRAAALRPTERQLASDAICAAIAEHSKWHEARLVCAFFPLPSEPQIAQLWEGNLATAFCFPRVVGTDVELIRLDDPTHRRAATWKLDAAHHASAPVVAPVEVDLFLVPGVAFTANGNRLGRGGGFYDRLLSRRSPRSTAIGVCFHFQVIDEMPREEHDQVVDLVVTERGALA